MFNWITPNWPAPPTIHAYATTRQGGVSVGRYASMNVGDHVGDNGAHVLANRQQLRASLHLPQAPFWLNQTHSTTCIHAETSTHRKADASITRTPHLPLVIMTADCLPILLCDKAGKEIAAIHAGWRGLLDGVIEQTLSQMQTPGHQLLAWIGPSICGQCYEVGHDVMSLFEKHPAYSDDGFTPHHQKWLLNTTKIAERILKMHQVQAVYHAKRCTFEEKEHFFSYRRTGQTGRMATLIWMGSELS